MGGSSNARRPKPASSSSSSFSGSGIATLHADNHASMTFTISQSSRSSKLSNPSIALSSASSGPSSRPASRLGPDDELESDADADSFNDLSQFSGAVNPVEFDLSSGPERWVAEHFSRPPFKQQHRGGVDQRRRRTWRNLKQLANVPLESYPNSRTFVPTFFNITAPSSRYPAKKYCDITGLPAPYLHPRSGLRYSSATAFKVVSGLQNTVSQEYLAIRNAQTILK